MIAASDPQEFVPSGRQLAVRHPGPLRASSAKFSDGLHEDFLLDKFEKVSIKEKQDAEWWVLRKSPSENATLKINLKDDEGDVTRGQSHFHHKTYGSEFYDSSLNKSAELPERRVSKRISDINSSRFSSKHDSSANKNETFSSCTTAKSLTYGNNKGFELSARVKLTEVSYTEEELYVKGNTVIWSKGLVNECDSGLDNGRITICSYTSPFPVKHALWCTFHCERPAFDTSVIDVDLKSGPALSTPVPAVCIIDTFNIRVFTPKGEDFVISLPFQIGRVWGTKYGILIEKDITKDSGHLEDGKSILYSLAYPLDEVSPVALNVLSHIQISGAHLHVVYVSEDPSICVIYDTETKQHSIYKIRKIKPSERVEITDKMESGFPSFSNQSNKLKSRFSMWDCVKNSNLLTIPSPMNSRPGSVTSFSNVHQSKSHSSMATISRQSPAVSSVGSSWMPRLSRLQSDVQFGRTSCLQPNSSILDYTKTISNNFVSPDICLDYLWTEASSNQDDNFSGPASKVFLCDDLTGQWYLCYILPLKFQLYMLRVDFVNGKMNFGMLTSVSAKDAVPIPGLHLMAILEHNGNVTLYSGLNPVGKLHIGGTLVQHTPSPYVRKLSQFNSPFPRRSSLLPHCKQSDPKFDDHLLSPVLPEGSGLRAGKVLQVNFQLEKNIPKTVLNGFQDAIENRLTLRYSDGTYYRIILPNLSENPLVERCLLALRQCLVRDTASVVLTRWYATKNALGTQDVNLNQEWNMFENLLLELLGYDEEHSDAIEDCPVTPSCNPKRQKHSTSGSDDDWNVLLESEHQKVLPHYLNKILNNFRCYEKAKESIPPDASRINTKSLLFPSIKLIHYVFHLLYEDLKLDVLKMEETKSLARFLNKVSRDLRLFRYSLKYCRDFPEVCAVGNTEIISQEDMKFVNNKPFMEGGPPIGVLDFMKQVAKGGFSSYPYIENVNSRTRDIIQVYGVIMKEIHPSLPLENLISSIEITSTGDAISTQFECPIEGRCVPEQATLLMTQRHFTPHFLDTLPFGVYFTFYSALWKCRESPPSDWPIEAYTLLWRDDLAAQSKNVNEEDVNNCDKNGENGKGNQAVMISDPKPDCEQIDGMEDINNPLMKLRFPDDIRVLEARNMLQSSKPVPIVLVQRPDVSDHDFIEEQEKHLYAVCTRTFALSTGRGMFTLRTSTPVITEPLQSPQMCLTGKVPPKDTTVELVHIDTPSNMNLWPLFHNGVANGLRITPDAQNVDNTWIIFNKPKTSVEQQMEHAGFLMALGLNGHLKNLHVLSTYDYLIKLHEMTSIGILLGLSASFRGTSHLGLTKTLSIHVEALLPPTSMELDVQQNVQVAALLGVGLVYQGTSHRHIIEVLLSEIGRPPGPEMENSVDRESYSLAAGLSLGLVTLKQGDCFIGLSDLNVPDTLHYYMIGGNRRPLTGSQKDKYKVPSFQIREGSSVNLDVTAPGATIALGLMYLGTGNKAVADWMAPPETQYLLDFVRPDFLMFRILARALIMWNEVEPTRDWIESQVPNTVRPYCMVKPTGTVDVDYEAMNQAYCNIVAGACFALGLKYAGTANEEVFDTLLHYCHMFTKLTVKSTVELAGKPTVETCLNVLLLSISMVMAGTGNLDIMRLVRLLRKRVGVASSAAVTYGSHLAIHMALGLLFLGGGRYTLSNSAESIAVLICAFYPKFPTHSNDNRYHLQAFRHLYVLAVEPRLVIPKDINSMKRCYANLRVVRLDGSQSTVRGPCIIPDLDTLYKVAVDDERYWPVVFERGRNWDVLGMILATSGFIEVKQRAGCLNYITDKFGYHSQLARTLTQSDAVPWDPPPSSIESFTNDDVIKCFCDHFLKKLANCGKGEDRMRQILTKVTYEAVVKDKLPLVPVFAFIIKLIHEMDSSTSALNLEQFKLISQTVLDTPLATNLVSSETMLALHQEITGIMETWENDLIPNLKLYLKGELSGTLNSKFVSYVTYYDLPFGCLSLSSEGNFLEVLCKLRSKLPARIVKKLTNFDRA